MENKVASSSRFCFSAAFVLLLAIVQAIIPNAAYAWFNDVTDSYPATQEIAISGEVLTGADVPEGTYEISATTSSYMCKITNVTLASVGGELWVTFNTSKAYNALYFGTAEEAAASTNADGTDMSAYYIADPFEGYVEHRFSIAIPALNTPLTIATFSGGSKGVEGGMWYTRTVVFASSAEVEAAVTASGKAPSFGDDANDSAPSGEAADPSSNSASVSPDSGQTDQDHAAGNSEETPIEKAKRLIAALPADPDEATESMRPEVESAQAAYDVLSAAEQSELDAAIVPGASLTYGRMLESAQWGLLAGAPVDNTVALPDGDYTASVTSSSSMGKTTSQRVRSWSVTSLAVENGKATAIVTCSAQSAFQSMRVGGLTYVATVIDGVPQFQIPVVVNGVTTFTVDASSVANSLAYQLTVSLPPDARPDDASGDNGSASYAPNAPGEDGPGGSSSATEPGSSITGLHQATVTGITSKVYNGKPQTQNVTVTIGDTILQKDVDYTVKYSNNVNAGFGSVTIEGKGEYSGSGIGATFKIEPARITSVELAAPSHAYTGKPWKPAVKTVKAGSLTLAKSDYTVEYADAKSKTAGSYIVLVSAEGNFTGAKLATYRITQASNKVTVAKKSVKKMLKAKKLAKKAQTFSLPKATVKFGKAKWKVAAKDPKRALTLLGNKVKVKKGAKKGVYTLKLVAFVAKNGNYKAAKSKTVTVKVTVK